MATPADQRLLELLDKWLKSLELHLKYASLDDDSYAKIQPWHEHQRPSRWIIDLARQKALALQAQVQDRVKMGDAKFADSLELMNFLANLVGVEHIERFIPLASAEAEREVSLAAPDGTATVLVNPAATQTREMPKFVAASPRMPETVGSAAIVRTERKSAVKASAKPPAAAKLPLAAAKLPAAKTREHEVSQTMQEQIIADAARLVHWGRKWYELAELISSMAGRPPLTEVRRILKDNKAVIDKKAGRS